MKCEKLPPGEAAFAEIIWRNEPVQSGELVKLCEKEIGWKKSTTYTVLKKLCDKGIFQNNNAVVSSRIKREDFLAKQSRHFVEDVFGGSLPNFLAAFIGGEKLNENQAAELKKLIDKHRE